MKIVLLTCIILLASGILLFGFMVPHTALFSNPFSAAPSSNVQEITLYAVGDIMLDRGVAYRTNNEGKGDYKFPFLKIADDLKRADILFGNLESVISDKGNKVGSAYSFRASPEAIQGLSYAGFSMLSIANNHALDYTRTALEDSMRRLQRAGIEYVGGGFNAQEAFGLKIKEVKGTKIGFLALTDLGPSSWKASEKISGIAQFKDSEVVEIQKKIQEAKKNVDVLVISMHWGDEYASQPSNAQIALALAFVDAGADLVLGHHSHVVQRPIVPYKSAWIVYSLGNFVFDQGFSEKTMEGLLLKVSISDKKIVAVESQNIRITKLFQPYLSQ